MDECYANIDECYANIDECYANIYECYPHLLKCYANIGECYANIDEYYDNIFTFFLSLKMTKIIAWGETPGMLSPTGSLAEGEQQYAKMFDAFSVAGVVCVETQVFTLAIIFVAFSDF